MSEIKTEQVQAPLGEAEILALPLNEMRDAIEAKANKESVEPSKEVKEVTETNSTETTEVVEGEQSEEVTETDSTVTDETVTTEQPAEIKKLQDALAAKEQQFKELQGQFTKDRQEMAKLNAKFDVLMSLQKTPAEGETTNPMDALKEVNPEAATLFEKLFKAQEEKLTKQLSEKTDKLEADRSTEIVQRNVAAFQTEVETFLKGDLAPLEAEIAAVIDSDIVGWTKKIHESPNAFKEVYEAVVAKNLDKVVELKSKAKKPSNTKEKINAQPESKTKTTTKTVVDATPEQLKKMTFDEVEALRKKGGLPMKSED